MGRRGGADYQGIQTTEGKHTKNYHLLLQKNSLKRKYCTYRYIILIIKIIIITFSNENLRQKYWPILTYILSPWSSVLL
jgi:hypothetical protein